jgi:hypothetical protein
MNCKIKLLYRKLFLFKTTYTYGKMQRIFFLHAVLSIFLQMVAFWPTDSTTAHQHQARTTHFVL